MALCAFRLILDINLTVPENTYFHIIEDNNDVLLAFHSINGKKVQSYSRELQWIHDNSESVHIDIELSTGERVPYIELKRSEQPFLISVNGIIQEAKFTVADILFKVPNNQNLKDIDFAKTKKQWVLGLLEKFFDNYVLVTNDITFVRKNIFDAIFIEVSESREEYDFPHELPSDMVFNTVGADVGWKDPGKSGYLKITVSPQQVSAIQQRLDGSNPVLLYEKLLIDAKEQAHISKNYDLCVVLIENAFEVFLHTILGECCRIKRIEKLPSKEKTTRLVNYYDALRNGNVREDLLRRYFKYLSGKSIVGTEVYNAWLTSTYEKRNIIIHKGEYGTTEQQAKEAFNSTITIIKEIKEILESSLAYVPIQEGPS